MNDAELGRLLCEHSLLEGDFVLRSGRRSSWYLDKYRFETQPELLRPLGERIAAAVAEHEPEAVRLAGPALGAVALAASASMASGRPFIIVRGETKDYGTANRIEGRSSPETSCAWWRTSSPQAVRSRRRSKLCAVRASTSGMRSVWSTGRRVAPTRSRASECDFARSSGRASCSRMKKVPQNRMVEPKAPDC